MTRREWMEENYPSCVDEEYKGGVYGCPYEYDELPNNKRDMNECKRIGCEECWNKDIDWSGEE